MDKKKMAAKVTEALANEKHPKVSCLLAMAINGFSNSNVQTKVDLWVKSGSSVGHRLWFDPLEVVVALALRVDGDDGGSTETGDDRTPVWTWAKIKVEKCKRIWQYRFTAVTRWRFINVGIYL